MTNTAVLHSVPDATVTVHPGLGERGGSGPPAEELSCTMGIYHVSLLVNALVALGSRDGSAHVHWSRSGGMWMRGCCG